MEIVTTGIITIILKKLIESKQNKIMLAEQRRINLINEINRNAKQPTLRAVEDKEKIKKLKEFLAKHRTERVEK